MNMFNKEKSSKLAVILQVITLTFYFLTFVLLITAAGLFGKGRSIANEGLQKEICPLFLAEDNPRPSTANCGYAIAGDVLAAIGLGILFAIGIAKMVIGLMKNNILLLIDIILLVITSVFALTAAIVIDAGVGAVCKYYEMYNFKCSELKYYNAFVGSAVCGSLALGFLVVSVVMYVITAVISRKEEKN